jgi:hypothetical protein
MVNVVYTRMNIEFLNLLKPAKERDKGGKKEK